MAVTTRIPVNSPIIHMTGPIAGQLNQYGIENWPQTPQGFVPPSATNQSIGFFGATSGSGSTLSTSAVMLGLAMTFTPVMALGANILLLASGFLNVTVQPPGGASSYGAHFRLMVGTGTPPNNGDAQTGTQVGGDVAAELLVDGVSLLTTVSLSWPFTIQGVFPNGPATLVPYWVDIAASMDDINQLGAWNNVNVTVQEVGVPS